MQGQYNFIKIQNVMLRNFSLYKKGGKDYEVNEDINTGVYCLAGANGLGKTTFLNSINYGLTGIVLEPDKEVFSPSEIVSSNKRYTERYFIGRISKSDEEKAEIELLFKINDKYFRIIRGFFKREELRLFEVYTITSNKKKFTFQNKEKSPKQLNDDYQKMLAEEIGFGNFDFFAFLQLYVLTFDENRRMIFWDERASSHALSIVFNSDPKDAEKISELLRNIERHDSNARNAKWQSTQAKKKVEELTKPKGKRNPNIEKLEKEYQRLNKDAQKVEITTRNIKIEYDTMLKQQSYLNSEIMQLKIEHTKLFSRYSKPRSILIENVNVQHSISKQECCLCGSQGSHVVDNIERSIHKDKCPLCSTVINESDSAEQNRLLKLIQKNDEKISAKSNELDSLIYEVDGKKTELEKSEIEFNTIKRKIDRLTKDNPDVSFQSTGDKGIDALISQYKAQYESSLLESENEYEKRNKVKLQLDKLLKKVEASYRQGETVFVPIFKKLAKSFIGLDLNIQPQRGEKGLKLVLELRDTARTSSFQLSESQRFFLDIALRMALTIFLSQKTSGATMMIDTPEGSLDIAYESRVGNMFAEYANIYHQNLLMTSNINASQLLLSLAEKCGKKTMRFRRMLEWTELSLIQKEGEHLFKSVYEKIEKALQKIK